MGCGAVARLARDPRLIGIASQWLGGAAIPFKATLFEKSPNANWLVSWHQDTALPLSRHHDAAGWGPWSTKSGVTYAHAPASVLETIVALRVHLDDSTADNGPLRLLPGSHVHGVLSDAQILDMSRRITEAQCTVGAGGVLAMRPLIIHASSKARAAATRRVLHLEYAASLRLESGLELRVA
jgi:ectoine hydroxylase-related dioxygenase (phytanoyl-CoA dioxygenase family)